MATDDHPNTIGNNARLNVGAKLSGSIEQASDLDVFQISLVAGQSICIEVSRKGVAGSGGLTDPYLSLFDANGRLVSYDDQSFGSGNARMNVLVPASGTYYVVVEDYDAGTGQYDLGAYRRNVVPSSSSADIASGTSSPDTMAMGRGRDNFNGGAGDDYLDGGEDIDTISYSRPAGNYSLERVPLGGWASGVAAGWVVRDQVGTDGNDIVVNVERIRFADTKWALDLDGAAGFTVKLIGALFGKAAVANREYVGIGLSQLDSGVTQDALVTLALQARMGSKPSPTELVTVLYTNLVGVAPSAADLATYTGMLNSGAITQVGLVGLAADQAINLANIGFSDLVSHGVGYI